MRYTNHRVVWQTVYRLDPVRPTRLHVPVTTRGCDSHQHANAHSEFWPYYRVQVQRMLADGGVDGIHRNILPVSAA